MDPERDSTMPDRFETVATGVVAAVFERARPIPPSLELLLEGGRDPDGRQWTPIRVAHRTPLRLGGASATCATDDHRLSPWLRGFHIGSDGLVRDLLLQACTDCGAVCVRDQSIDVVPTRFASRSAPRRRDKVIGWYTGARPRQRQYT